MIRHFLKCVHEGRKTPASKQQFIAPRGQFLSCCGANVSGCTRACPAAVSSLSAALSPQAAPVENPYEQ